MANESDKPLKFRSGDPLLASDVNTIIQALIKRISGAEPIYTRANPNGSLIVGLNEERIRNPPTTRVFARITAEVEDAEFSGTYEWERDTGPGPDSGQAREYFATEKIPADTFVTLFKMDGDWWFIVPTNPMFVELGAEDPETPGTYAWTKVRGDGPASGNATEIDNTEDIPETTSVVIFWAEEKWWFVVPASGEADGASVRLTPYSFGSIGSSGGVATPTNFESDDHPYDFDRGSVTWKARVADFSSTLDDGDVIAIRKSGIYTIEVFGLFTSDGTAKPYDASILVYTKRTYDDPNLYRVVVGSGYADKGGNPTPNPAITLKLNKDDDMFIQFWPGVTNLDTGSHTYEFSGGRASVMYRGL